MQDNGGVGGATDMPPAPHQSRPKLWPQPQAIVGAAGQGHHRGGEETKGHTKKGDHKPGLVSGASVCGENRSADSWRVERHE